MSKLALGVGVGLTVAGSFLSGTKTAQEKIAAVGKEVKRLNAKRLKVGVEAFLKIYLFNLQFLLFFFSHSRKSEFYRCKNKQ